MAVDFSNYSNYDNKTSFSSVIFGANSPLLEVELNELQQIMATYRELITSILGSGVSTVLSNDGTAYDLPYEVDKSTATVNGHTRTFYILHIKNCVVTNTKGVMFYVEDESVSIDKVGNKVYFKAWEETVTHTSELKEYGNVNGNTITNKILDGRSVGETTRRKVLKHELVVGSAVPKDTDLISYIEVGEIVKEGDNNTIKVTNYGNVLSILNALKEHLNDKDNPHEVTKDQVGLSNVDNTSDANKPISNATQEALDIIDTDIQVLDNKLDMVSSNLGGVSFSIEDGILTATYDDGQ